MPDGWSSRLPLGALRRRAPPGDPGDRRDARHRPGRGHPARGGRRGYDPRRGGPRPAELGVRPHPAARAVDAALARVPQDQRGLRLHVLLLHHPDAARPPQEPRRRGHRERGARARSPRRAGARARRAGLDPLRARPRREGRPRLPAAAARSRRRPALDPRHVRLSRDAQRQGPGRDRLGGESRQVRGHSPAARERAGAEAHEAAHREGEPAGHDRADSRARARASRSGRRSSSASRARRPTTSRGCWSSSRRAASTTSASSPSPTRRGPLRGTSPAVCPPA